MSTNTQFTKEELDHDQCPPHITGDRVRAWYDAKIDLYRALSLTQSHPPGLGLTLSQEKTQEGDTHAQSTLKDTPAVTSKEGGQPTHSDVHSSGKDEEEGDGTSTDIAAKGVAHPPRTPIFKGGEDPLMQTLDKSLQKLPLLHTDSPHTQMSALKDSRKQLVVQSQKQQPPVHLEEEDEEVYDVASGSEEETEEDESEEELEITEQPEPSKKRRGVTQKDTSSRKKAKVEPSPEKKPSRKRSTKAKVPFAMARKMIPPMIFDEDEIRNLALDFPRELREEIFEACDLINCQGWFELAKGPSTSHEQGPLLRSKVDLALLDKIDALTTSVVDVKIELSALKTMLGEKLSELIASIQHRVPASVERDPPPQE